jgi:amino acid transporter
MTPSAHGLRHAALGLASGVVIGVASTAPAYSLAVTLGFVTRELGGASVAAPAVLLLAVLPVLGIAVAFDRLNRWQSDCGTTFAWVTRTMGPWLGWTAGWVTVAAGALVMASLAQVSALYTFQLFGLGSLVQSRAAVALAGVAWLAWTTWICVRGIEPTARLQYTLLAIELVALVVFAVAALAAPGGEAQPSLSWLGFATVRDSSALAGALAIAVFLYWGWESALSLNEETKDSARTPGRAGYLSLLVLLVTYVLVAIAAQSVRGPAYLAGHADDVFAALAPQVLPAPWDRLITFAVLASAVAACQTTLLPTARTLLSMAAAGALPGPMARIHPGFRTPSLATWILGGVSCAWFTAISFASPDVLADSIDAIGLLVAFSYAITGYACPLAYLRSGVRGAKEALLLVAAPLAGAAALTWVFVRLCASFAAPVALPLALVLAVLAAGALLMLLQFRAAPAFFNNSRP